MIQDEPEQLEQMFSDLRGATEVYNEYPYWKNYERIFLPFIREHGIANFRASGNPFIASFPLGEVPTRSRLKQRLLGTLLGPGRIGRRLGVSVLREQARQYFANWQRDNYLALRCRDRDGQLELLADSLAGNPANFFEADGRAYTTEHLTKYTYYLLMTEHFDFERGAVVLEIGGNYGSQAETIAKLHPQLRFVLVELPTQLYMCERYLGEVFRGQVVEYAETRELEEIDEEAFDGRRFLCLLPHQIERLRVRADLFINTASFQEMTPRVVAHYLRFVDELVTDTCYLHEVMSGHHPGGPTFDDYERGLRGWRCVLREPNCDSKNVIGEGYEDTIWKRR